MQPHPPLIHHWFGQLPAWTRYVKLFASPYLLNPYVSYHRVESDWIYTGGNDIINDGTWVWSNGTKIIGYKNWSVMFHIKFFIELVNVISCRRKWPGGNDEPNGVTDENCLLKASVYLWEWVDMPCTSKIKALCQKSMSRSFLWHIYIAHTTEGKLLAYFNNIICRNLPSPMFHRSMFQQRSMRGDTHSSGDAFQLQL